MFPSLQAVHEVLGVDVDVGVEHVEPLRQVLLHGVQVLVSPGETPELPLLYQLEGERVFLTANINQSVFMIIIVKTGLFVQIFYIYLFLSLFLKTGQTTFFQWLDQKFSVQLRKSSAHVVFVPVPHGSSSPRTRIPQFQAKADWNRSSFCCHWKFPPHRLHLSWTGEHWEANPPWFVTLTLSWLSWNSGSPRSQLD